MGSWAGEAWVVGGRGVVFSNFLRHGTCLVLTLPRPFFAFAHRPSHPHSFGVGALSLTAHLHPVVKTTPKQAELHVPAVCDAIDSAAAAHGIAHRNIRPVDVAKLLAKHPAALGMVNHERRKLMMPILRG